MSVAGSLQLRIIPGDALVARAGDGVLVIGRRDPAHAAAAASLLDGLRSVCGGADPSPGEALARRLVSEVIQRPAEEVPPFAALAPGRGGVDVLLTPGMEISWPGGEEWHTLSGRQAANWLDRVVPWEAGHLAVGVEPLDAGEHDPLSDLRDGVVTGRGAVVEWVAEPPGAGGAVADQDEDATEQQPSAAPEVYAGAPAGAVPATSMVVSAPSPPDAEDKAPPPPTPFEVVDLGGLSDVESREPLPVADRATADRLGLPSVEEAPPRDSAVEAPLVDGIRCARDHFNHPHVRYCVVCGIGMGQRTPAIVKGPRPPLGIVIVDDGSAFNLEAGYIIGREPDLDPSVASGQARAIVLADPDRAISRVHAELRLVGWDVTLTDRGSANGTFVLPPGAAGWGQLPSRQSVSLLSGARVAIGKRTFVFESHHVS